MPQWASSSTRCTMPCFPSPPGVAAGRALRRLQQSDWFTADDTLQQGSSCSQMLRTKPGWSKCSGPDATFSYRSQRTRLAGENSVRWLASLWSNTPKVFAIGALKGSWLRNVSHHSWNSFKIRPYSEQKIEMKPDIVMDISTVAATCETEPWLIFDEVSPGPATHPSPEPPSTSFLHYSFADW